MPALAIAAALLVATCWGGNFAASKFALTDFPPFIAVLLRFMIVSVLLAPLALRKPMPRLRDMLFIALTLIVLHFAFIFIAITHGLTITSVIVATQMGVPFSCIVSAVLFKDYLGPWRSVGLTVAFIGVLIIAGTPNASEYWGAFLLAILGALAWSSANIYLKRMPPTPVVCLLFWPALLSLPFLLALTLLFEQNQLTSILTSHKLAWAGIAYNTAISSLLGYGLWNWLISRYPLSHVAPYTLFAPVVGIATGVWLFDEPLTLQIILGALLSIIGVTIITLRRPRLAELEKA